MDQESREKGQSVPTLVVANVGSGDDSRISAPPETVIEIGDTEVADSRVRANGSSLDDAAPVEETGKVAEKSSSCVIGVDSDGAVLETQRVCRICHLNAKESGKSTNELIELGCGCRGELEVAHFDCAEAWFKVRGNRLCEICGNVAQNIRGAGINGFMAAWNESSADMHGASANGSRRCLQGQPLCNLLMACLVIAFVLPWFFRVNMF